MKKQSDTSGKQPSANRGIPAPLAVNPATDTTGVDDVKSFMTKNPPGNFQPDTDDTTVATLSATPETLAPDATAPAVDAQGEVVAPVQYAAPV